MTTSTELERVFHWFSFAGLPADSWVLVRASALRFWSRYFQLPGRDDVDEAQARELSLLAPGDAVSHFAAQLGGELVRADARCTQVLVRDGNSETTVSFLQRLIGLPPARIRASRIKIAACAPEVGVHVMQPVHLLGALVHEHHAAEPVTTDAGAHGLNEAIACAKAFIQAAVDAGRMRDALRCNEAVYGYAVSSAGLWLTARYDVPIINALSLDGRLPRAFHERDYPFMLRTLSEGLRACRRRLEEEQRAVHEEEPSDVFSVESVVVHDGWAKLTLRSEAGQRSERSARRASQIRPGDVVRVLGDGEVHIVSREAKARRPKKPRGRTH